MLTIKELYSDQKFDLIVYYLREHGILLADSLGTFDFDELIFIPGITSELIEDAKQLYFTFAASIAYSGLSGRRFRRHPDTKPETSGHLVG